MQGPLQRAVRVGPVIRGEARTIERQDAGVEVMDTIECRISSWKQHGGAQRWLCVNLPDRRLEVFIPLDFFQPEAGLLVGTPTHDALEIER